MLTWWHQQGEDVHRPCFVLQDVEVFYKKRPPPQVPEQGIEPFGSHWGTIYFHGSHFAPRLMKSRILKFGRGIHHDHTKKRDGGLLILSLFFGGYFPSKWREKSNKL